MCVAVVKEICGEDGDLGEVVLGVLGGCEGAQKAEETESPETCAVDAEAIPMKIQDRLFTGSTAICLQDFQVPETIFDLPAHVPTLTPLPTN